jgi:hypothetical protein
MFVIARRFCPAVFMRTINPHKVSGRKTPAIPVFPRFREGRLSRKTVEQNHKNQTEPIVLFALQFQEISLLLYYDKTTIL